MSTTVGPNGHAVAAWTSSEPWQYEWGIMAAAYDPATGWGAPETIFTRTVRRARPSIAVDELGRAIVAWVEDRNPDEVVATHYTPAGGWGNPVLLQYQQLGGTLAYVDIGGGVAFLTWATNDDDPIGEDTTWITHAVLP